MTTDIQAKPNQCPKCDSWNIDWQDIKHYDDDVCYIAACLDCDCAFEEWYVMKYSDTQIIENE